MKEKNLWYSWSCLLFLIGNSFEKIVFLVCLEKEKKNYKIVLFLIRKTFWQTSPSAVKSCFKFPFNDLWIYICECIVKIESHYLATVVRISQAFQCLFNIKKKFNLMKKIERFRWYFNHLSDRTQERHIISTFVIISFK